MLPKKSNPGQCQVCSESVEKSVISRHLEKCLAAESGKVAPSARPVPAFLLEIQARPYWLYVLARADASLDQFDGFLRQIWLECCGHMSAFSIGNQRFVSDEDGYADEDEPNMDIKLSEILLPKLSFKYEYDFGSTTLLKGKVVKALEISQTDKIRLLVRNADLRLACQACSKPATDLCTACIWEGDGLFCEACAAEHDCDEELLMPVVNSPRCGVCGYTG
jgi:hypothetical protein